MQFTTAALAVFAAAVGVVSAQPPPPPPPPTSNLDGPFALQLRGPNPNWNDKFISHTQTGGASNLAVPDRNSVNYFLNTTDKTLVYIPWPRPRGSREQYPFVVGTNLASNVGGIYVADDSEKGTAGWAFTQQGILEVGGLNRFHVCTIQTPRGPISGLAWQYGTARPDVADCTPVAIRRVNVPRGLGGPGGPRM
ncbi:uncharacterized protein DFL_007990 [Arthrobotrys flagrans]|uniref:Uncharacterized protein n=1 Tax=Arthrobotrys flagrans TaxID=97331 RepID=A0A436ZXH1_ARTFL|nr:hypothetical protein DFL_007990 [Arthrobotrys flagrans]